MKRLCCTVSALMLIALLFFGTVSTARAAGVIYVKANATGSNNGTSWVNAYTRLETAIAAATSGDQIWVAAGTYKPTTTTNRTLSFSLKSGVAIYGGFAGTETLLGQRNATTHVTTLSGDIGTVGTVTDNSYHVVYSITVDNTAILDGFTITGGRADGSTYPDNSGGGMLNFTSGNPTLTNLIFTNNYAAGQGGGMDGDHASPQLTNVTFTGNTSNYSGGGMANAYVSNPILTDVVFSGNAAAHDSGGLFNYQSSPTLLNVTISGNTAQFAAGLRNQNASNPSMTNMTISGNTASFTGGGMDNSSSSPTLTNVTFSGNSAPNNGAALANYSGSNPTIRDSIFWGDTGPEEIYNDTSTPSITDSLISGGCPSGATCAGTLLNSDPLLGPLANNGGFTKTRALSTGSPAIDAGNNATCASTDQRGLSRPLDGNGDTTATCDMGAYERGATTTTTITSDTPDYSVSGAGVTVNVTVASGSGTPTGSVKVSSSDSNCTITLASGTGSCVLHPVAGGLQTITATYQTDLTHEPSSDTEPHHVSAPKTFYPVAAQDGWVLESTETSSVGGTINSSATTFSLGDDAAKKQYRAILSFNTASLPDTAVITAVSLKVKQQSIVGGGNPVTTFQGFVADIKKGFFGTAAALQTTDFQAVPNQSYGPFNLTPASNWYTVNLTNAKAYINKLSTSGGLTQIRLRFKLDDNNNAIANYLSLFSGNAPTANRPQLIVFYYVP